MARHSSLTVPYDPDVDLEAKFRVLDDYRARGLFSALVEHALFGPIDLCTCPRCTYRFERQA